MFQIVLIFLLVTASKSDDETCPGGYRNGDTLERGRYWYECRNGQLVPRGCLSEDHKRIELGSTYDSNRVYRMQCVQDKDGYLTFVFKSCLYNGGEYEPGQQWDDIKYSYACVKEGDHLRLDVAGCIDQESRRRVGIDEKVIKGSFIYQCQRTKNGTCSMCPVGCTMDGREYRIGDTFERNDYWYSCVNDPLNNRKIAIKPGGCVNGGQRYNDQGTFHKNDLMYECYAREGEAKTTVIGCVRNGYERRLGDTWVEGSSPNQYEMTCKENGDNPVSVVQKRCTYDSNQGQYHIDPGCYRIYDSKAIGCLKYGTDNLEMRIFAMRDLESVNSLGLRYC